MRLFALCAALAAASLVCACGGGATCTGTTMSCVAVSECSPDKGHLTSEGTCDSADQVCCVPALSCPEENFRCCVAGAQYRPNCDNGVLTCPAEESQCM
jgi:hypothetical protein